MFFRVVSGLPAAIGALASAIPAVREVGLMSSFPLRSGSQRRLLRLELGSVGGRERPEGVTCLGHESHCSEQGLGLSGILTRLLSASEEVWRAESSVWPAAATREPVGVAGEPQPSPCQGSSSTGHCGRLCACWGAVALLLRVALLFFRWDSSRLGVLSSPSFPPCRQGGNHRVAVCGGARPVALCMRRLGRGSTAPRPSPPRAPPPPCTSHLPAPPTSPRTVVLSGLTLVSGMGCYGVTPLQPGLVTSQGCGSGCPGVATSSVLSPRPGWVSEEPFFTLWPWDRRSGGWWGGHAVWCHTCPP